MEKLEKLFKEKQKQEEEQVRMLYRQTTRMVSTPKKTATIGQCNRNQHKKLRNLMKQSLGTLVLESFTQRFKDLFKTAIWNKYCVDLESIKKEVEVEL